MSATNELETRPALRENRRDLPRVETECTAEVLVDAGDNFNVRLINVSRGGAQLGCSSAEAASLVLKASIVSPDQGAQFWLAFTLGSYPLKVRGRLAHSSPVGKGQHRIGIQFLEFAAQGREVLDAFIEECLIS